jgi:hypothetical protein
MRQVGIQEAAHVSLFHCCAIVDGEEQSPSGNEYISSCRLKESLFLICIRNQKRAKKIRLHAIITFYVHNRDRYIEKF